MLRGITKMPQLYGYVASTPRPTAQVLLQTPQEDPLLATWQYGLGRSLVWTSDLKGQWARDWVRWGQFSQLMGQMIGWLLPPPGSPRLGLEARPQGDQIVLTASARDDDGRPATGLHVTGELLAADGSSRPLALREITPASYGTAVSELTAGAYQVQLVATDADGRPFATAGGGAAIQPGKEYRGQAGDRALLVSLAQITGGQVDLPPAEVYDSTAAGGGTAHDLALQLLWLALALLPVEVAVRRLWPRPPP